MFSPDPEKARAGYSFLGYAFLYHRAIDESSPIITFDKSSSIISEYHERFMIKDRFLIDKLNDMIPYIKGTSHVQLRPVIPLQVEFYP